MSRIIALSFIDLYSFVRSMYHVHERAIISVSTGVDVQRNTDGDTASKLAGQGVIRPSLNTYDFFLMLWYQLYECFFVFLYMHFHNLSFSASLV